MAVFKRILRWFIPFLAAFLIWLMIVSDKDYTIIIDAPIEVYEPRPDKILKNEVPSSGQVMFRGSGRQLMIAKYLDQPKLILDVSTIKRQYRINVNEYFGKYSNRVIYPREAIEFLEVVYPESINVVIDEKITSEIPVHINASVQCRPGYIITHQPDPDPSSISVTGPKSFVSAIRLLESRKLEFTDVTQSLQRSVSIDNPNPGFVKLARDEVMFSVKIESIGERVIRGLPVTVVNSPAELEIELVPASVSITVVGGNDIIQAVRPEDISVVFDYAGQWIPNTYYYTPEVEVPASLIEWKRMEPEKIEVIIVRR